MSGPQYPSVSDRPRVKGGLPPVASFTKEVNPRLAKRPLKINGRLANHRLTSLVKEATVSHCQDFYPGALSCSQCSANSYNMGHTEMKFTGA